jgi:hypothetical protein
VVADEDRRRTEPPRSSLDRGTRSVTTTAEMEALRRRVWREQGVVSLAIDDVTDGDRQGQGAQAVEWCRTAECRNSARKKRIFDSGGGQASCAAGGRAAQVKAGVVSVAAPDHSSRAQKKVLVRKNVVLSSETHIAYPVATR